jgi:hypothetical protein
MSSDFDTSSTIIVQVRIVRKSNSSIESNGIMVRDWKTKNLDLYQHGNTKPHQYIQICGSGLKFGPVSASKAITNLEKFHA